MMSPSIALSGSVKSILVTRMDGLGDAVLCTVLLNGLRQCFPDAQITLLVRPHMQSLTQIMPEWVRVVPSPVDPSESVAGEEREVAKRMGGLRESCRADLAIVGEFNRVWASELAAMLSGAKPIVVFDTATGLNVHNRVVRETLGFGMPDGWETVPAECGSSEVRKYHRMLEALGLPGKSDLPAIVVSAQDRAAAEGQWATLGLNGRQTVAFFPGSGAGLARSLKPSAWAQWIKHVAQTRPVVLLGADTDQPALDAITACTIPPEVRRLMLPRASLGQLAAFLEGAAAYIGADTGPMHIAAALGRPTLGVFGGGTMGSLGNGQSPERFLPVGKRTAAIRMPLDCYGCDWECPFGSRLCLTRMPADKVLEAGDEFLRDYLDGRENPDPLSPRVFNLHPPTDVPVDLLGPVMRQHRLLLRMNHDMLERHDYLVRHVTNNGLLGLRTRIQRLFGR